MNKLALLLISSLTICCGINTDNECDRNGNYYLQYVQISGNCGPANDEVVALSFETHPGACMSGDAYEFRFIRNGLSGTAECEARSDRSLACTLDVSGSCFSRYDVIATPQ